MFWKLQNRFCLLSLLTVLGAVLVLLALPLLGVSCYLFIDSNLGIALSPIWLALLIEVTGLVAVLTWPSKLIIITLLVPLLSILSVLTCAFSGALTCFYGGIVYVRGVDSVQTALNASAPGVTLDSFCLFNNISNFFPNDISDQFHFMETLVPSCQELDRTAPYLLSLCAITALSMVISLLLCGLSALALLSCKADTGSVPDTGLGEESDVQVRRMRKRLPYAE